MPEGGATPQTGSSQSGCCSTVEVKVERLLTVGASYGPRPGRRGVGNEAQLRSDLSLDRGLRGPDGPRRVRRNPVQVAKPHGNRVSGAFSIGFVTLHEPADQGRGVWVVLLSSAA